MRKIDENFMENFQILFHLSCLNGLKKVVQFRNDDHFPSNEVTQQSCYQLFNYFTEMKTISFFNLARLS